MRAVAAAAGDHAIDTTDGVRVVLEHGSWVLVRPDQAEALAHVWAETPCSAQSADLLASWSSLVAEAGR
jgi:phosphomannomutase